MATTRAALTEADIRTLVRGQTEDERAAAAHKICRRIDDGLPEEDRAAAEDILRMMLTPTAKPYFQSYLALILYDENRKDEAKESARAACQSTSPVLASTRERLIKFGLCETPKS